MHSLYKFENLRVAQALSDRLSQLKITNKILKTEFYFELVVEHFSIEAESELNTFLKNPNDPKYLSASWEAGKPSHIPQSSSYQSNVLKNFLAHAGIVTLSVFAISISVFLLTQIGLLNPMSSPFAFFTHQPFDLSESWRFIAPVFLHFGVLHIVFNTLWWWQLGGVIEANHGKQILLLLFLFSAFASNLSQYFLVGPYFGGLSGVVYALVGYCWIFGNLNKNSKVRLENPLFIFLLTWLALGFIDLLPVNIANYAHLTGLISGMILAALVTKLKIFKN